MQGHRGPQHLDPPGDVVWVLAQSGDPLRGWSLYPRWEPGRGQYLGVVGRGRARDPWVGQGKAGCLGNAREREGWGLRVAASSCVGRSQGRLLGCACDPVTAGWRWQACGQQPLAVAGRGPGSCATVAAARSRGGAPLWSLCNYMRSRGPGPKPSRGPEGAPGPTSPGCGHGLVPVHRSANVPCVLAASPPHVRGGGFHEAGTLPPGSEAGGEGGAWLVEEMAWSQVAPRVSWRGETGRTGPRLPGHPPTSLWPQCHPLRPTLPSLLRPCLRLHNCHACPGGN